jgi:transposase
MDQKQTTLEKEHTTKFHVLFVAFELSNSTWKMACSDGRKVRHVTVTARDLDQVERALLKAKDHFAMAEGCSTVSCYEAGRDGFWLHRYLQGQGIDNVVVDSASLEVDRRLRRAKTDRIDAGKLLRMLIRYQGGEKQLWRVVRVPSRADEDARHLHRELEGLKRERTRQRNRIHGILMQQGLCIPNPSKKRFLKDLEALRTWDGQQLPVGLKARLVRTYQQLRLVVIFFPLGLFINKAHLNRTLSIQVHIPLGESDNNAGSSK